eukprot:c36934_g1_i1 orf=1-159(-)
MHLDCIQRTNEGFDKQTSVGGHMRCGLGEKHIRNIIFIVHLSGAVQGSEKSEL